MRSADEVLEGLAYGVAVAEADKRLSYVNRRARELLMPSAAVGSADAPLTCCEAICDHLEPVLGGGCLSERARAATATLPEVRMDLETGTLSSAAWVTASPPPTATGSSSTSAPASPAIAAGAPRRPGRAAPPTRRPTSRSPPWDGSRSRDRTGRSAATGSASGPASCSSS